MQYYIYYRNLFPLSLILASPSCAIIEHDWCKAVEYNLIDNVSFTPQGFWHRASWGFPKGKINVDEEPHKCAIREVSNNSVIVT